MMYDSELVIMSTGALSSTGISQTVLLFLQQMRTQWGRGFSQSMLHLQT